MIGHMQGLVEEKEAIEKNSIVHRLPLVQKLPSREIYSKRLVFNVSGIVTDEEGEPLIGVNIQVKGSDKGTTTDFDGQFMIDDIYEIAELVVSFYLFHTQTDE